MKEREKMTYGQGRDEVIKDKRTSSRMKAEVQVQQRGRRGGRRERETHKVEG